MRPRWGTSWTHPATCTAATIAATATRPVGTDHTRCTFTAPDTATCATEVAIGGSLILVRTTGEGEGFTAWYGTGAFKGITGTGTSHNLGQTNNSDVVLRYRLA